MKSKAKDERIVKQSNEICAHLYPLIIILTIIQAIFKYLLLTQNITDYILEIIAILGSIGYLLIRTYITGIPLFRHSDKCVHEIQNRYVMHSFYICFITYVFGEFILMFVFDKWILSSTYVLVWIIPACIYTFKIVKNGLFVWGSKKAEVAGVKSFKVRVAIGSIFYGVVMEWKVLFKNNNFHPIGLILVIMMAIGWGIPFYFIMKSIKNKSERHSNNELMEIEQENKNDM
ncbi:hypothetical protein LL037_18160 [Clostridium estertheticum]|uniref:Uncharacterized protein n=1 Tax=Clostridium estertheticum TaxID=238834 RepID=A0AA47I7Z1_9CLOT|nr:DUF6773 family protein [Clostridium estertheticum]MBU3153724.1 hypothetical protein [Clostridium estertheticum]MBU3200208.1 hypothetical protein [Clostridium estertheticum]WAG61490.1 hypothetical protein LL038_04360 [Clostridium estertheticum]WAG64382.1 hypothetical protein LL037_18160 [Clostridium estertheticum]